MTISLPPIGGCVDLDPAEVSIPARVTMATAMAERASRQPWLRSIASTILTLRQQPMQDAALALTWVGSFCKVPDCEGRDAVADVLHTFRTGAGDCLNLCALLLALLLALRHRARIRTIYLPNNKQDHVAVEVWDGKAWTWADPMAEHPALGVLGVNEPWTTTPPGVVA